MWTRPPIRMIDEASAFIRTLQPLLKKHIHAGLEELWVHLGSGKMLRDDLEGYRILLRGKLRIIYRMHTRKKIEVAAVGPRRIIYEENARLLAHQER